MSCLCSGFPFHLMHRLLLFHPYSYNIKMFNFYYMAEMPSWVYFSLPLLIYSFTCTTSCCLHHSATSSPPP